MKGLGLAGLLAGTGWLACGCAATAGRPDDRAALLALHEAQRRAHLAEDAAGLVALFADDFVELREGVLVRPTRAASEARLRRYFEAVEFLAWDDLAPPEIRLSDDGTLATMAVQKLVRLRTVGADGSPSVERTIFAWLATCVREEGGWRLAGVVSTRRAEDAGATLAAARHALHARGRAPDDDRLARLSGVRASVHGSGPSGAYRLELDLPRAGPWRFRWIFPGRPESLCEIDGAQGWSLEGETRTPLTPAEVEMVRGHAFPLLVPDFETFFPGIEREGTRRESGSLLERLRLTDRLAQPASADFDLANDRLVQLVLKDTRSDPPEDVTIVFETWQSIGGLLWPRRVVAHDRSGAWVMDFEGLALTFE